MIAKIRHKMAAERGASKEAEEWPMEKRRPNRDPVHGKMMTESLLSAKKLQTLETLKVKVTVGCLGASGQPVLEHVGNLELGNVSVLAAPVKIPIKTAFAMNRKFPQIILIFS